MGRLVFVLKLGAFFLVTCYGWLLFRATSIQQVMDFTAILFFDWPDLSLSIKRPPLVAFLSIPLLLLYEVAEYSTRNVRFYTSLWKPVFGAFAAYALLMVAMGLSNEPVQFISFQF